MNNEQFKAFKELVQEANQGIKIDDLISSRIGGGYKFEREGNVINVAPNPLKPGGDYNDQSFKIFTNTNSYCNYQDSRRGERKDCVTFLKEYDNLNFNDAGIKLIEYAGLGHRLSMITEDSNYRHKEPIKRELQPVVTKTKGDNAPKDRTALINFAAKNIEKAKYLLEDRGLSLDILKKYKVGYVPDGTGQDKKYKYVFPVANDYVIVRSDTKDKKMRYQNWGKPKPLNLEYMQNPSLTDKAIFVVEGYIDALSIEMLGYKAIAINSADNADAFTEQLKENKKNLSEKVLIIAGDKDTAGSIMNTKIMNELKGLGIDSTNYIIPYSGDFNQWLVADKSSMEQDLKGLVDKMNKGEYKNQVDIQVEAKEIVSESSTKEPPRQEGIFEHNNCYCKWVNKGDTFRVKEITDFVIEPLEMIEGPTTKALDVIIHTKSGRNYRRVLSIEALMSGHQKFKKELDALLIFDGKDTELEAIKRILLSKEFKIKRGVECTGFHKIGGEWFFVSGDKAINQNLQPLDDLVMIKSYKYLDTSLLNYEPITKEELIKISKALFGFNELGKVAIVLGSVCSMFLKQRLWDVDIRVPHLMMIGERGSGKTQTLNYIVKPIFGLDPKENSENVGGITDFVLKTLSKSSNFTPLLLEEFKGNARIGLGKLLEFFRNAYDHIPTKTGNKDKTVDEYVPVAPIVLVGEVSVEEGATQERSLKINLAKKFFDKDKKDYFDLLMNERKLLNKLGRALLNAALTINDEELKNRYKLFSSKIDKKIEDTRVQNNIACGFIGISLLENVFSSLGLDMQKEVGFNFAQIFAKMQTTTYYDLLGGSSKSKTNVDTTLEEFDVMALNNLIKENVDYYKEDGRLIIAISKIYNDFLKHIKQCGKEIDVLPTSQQFSRQLKDKDYCINNSATKRFTQSTYEGSKTICIKASVLDIQKMLDAGLELNAFLEDN